MTLERLQRRAPVLLHIVKSLYLARYLIREMLPHDAIFWRKDKRTII